MFDISNISVGTINTGLTLRLYPRTTGKVCAVVCCVGVVVLCACCQAQLRLRFAGGAERGAYRWNARAPAEACSPARVA